MLLTVTISDKTLGLKQLFQGLSLTVSEKEKVAIVGRNGVGKTTLFNMLSGADDHFAGEIQRRKGMSLMATAQEHNEPSDLITIDYITGGLPHYHRLHQIIESYPATMGSDERKIQQYSEALERFTELGYFEIENEIEREMNAYQLAREVLRRPFMQLSGGQKRFVELIKVAVARADLALVDEPTNHMDTEAKEAFISWMKQTPMAVVVITHDRDVLQAVDRIIEIKDKKAISFTGNYDAYLKQNTVSTTSAVMQYEVAQRTLEKLKQQILAARAKKVNGSSDTATKFRIMEERLQRQYDQLAAQSTRPSFWIDQDSVAQMQPKMAGKYERYKARGLRMRADAGDQRHARILAIRNLDIGYEQPIIRDLNITLGPGERLRVHGRNGVGKSTLLKTILHSAGVYPQTTKIFGGDIEIGDGVRIGVYEQEISNTYLNMRLGEAIIAIYRDKNVPINDQKVRKLLSDYLFDPQDDYQVPVKNLSGGQKARLQLISMLAQQPNILILDEPTNHLDLPSIEELEAALNRYEGAILYVSHDSYFCQNIGGETIRIGEQ